MHTATARQVLKDIEFIRVQLEEETRSTEWRLGWITAVVLARAVGHVLTKVDGGRCPVVREVANELHRKWKAPVDEHAIFRDFIEEERNSILKEYELGMSEGPVLLSGVTWNPEFGDAVDHQDLIGDNIYRPMLSGPYEGEDGRSLLDDVIGWWHAQLDIVDSETAKRLGFSGDRSRKA